MLLAPLRSFHPTPVGALAAASLAAVGLWARPLSAEEPRSADQVLEAAAEAWSADGALVQQIRLTATNARGRVQERELLVYARRDGETVRVRGEITAPTALAGTRFLTSYDAAGAERSYLYLPALGQVQEIRSERRRSSLLGTDFAVEDLLPPPVDQASHAIRSQDDAGWVIETTFADGAHAWSRALVTVHRDDMLPWRTELFDGGAAPTKVLEILEVTEVEGRDVPRLIQARSADGGQTTLEVLDARFDPSGVLAPMALFSEAALADPAPAWPAGGTSP